jgi:hypothetical protein
VPTEVFSTYSWIIMSQDKSVRRFGIPAIAMGYGFSMGWNWRYLAFLGFIPILVMGYGEHSILGALVGYNEVLIRLLYAVLLSAPFYFFGLWRGVWASGLLVVAFAVRAGALCHIGVYDILIEDIARYGTLMALVVFNVTWRRK